jgi:uncharacterized protein YjbJ (UPF0337 family)
MNEHILKGKWQQLKGDIRQTWGKLTDDDMQRAEGSTEKLAGALHERYGWTRDAATKKVADGPDRRKGPAVTRRAARRRPSTGRRIVRTLGCLVVLALAAAAGVAGWGWWRLGQPFQGFAGDGVTVAVEPGTPAGAILERLEDEGVLADAGLTRLWLVWRLGDPPLHAGEYRFEGTASAHRVLDKLIRGEVVTHKVTLVEGQTLEETAATLAAAGFGDREAFERAMRDPAPIADLDPVATDLEGNLFPDTYGFARGTSETENVAALVRSFRDRWARVEARRRSRSRRCRGRADSHGRCAVPQPRHLSLTAGAQGRVGGDLRTDRPKSSWRSREVEGPGRSPGRARGHARYRHR